MLFQILKIFPRFIFCQLLGKTYYRIHICFHFDLFLVHILLIKEHSLFVHRGIGLENSLSNVANLSQGKPWLRNPINLMWKVMWEEGSPLTGVVMWTLERQWFAYIGRCVCLCLSPTLHGVASVNGELILDSTQIKSPKLCQDDKQIICNWSLQNRGSKRLYLWEFNYLIVFFYSIDLKINLLLF